VDPTAVVEPDRLLRGVYEVMGGASEPANVTLRRTALLSRLGQYWDGASTWWRERVVEFNFRSQVSLLSRLGVDAPGWQHLGWAFTGALLLWLLWVTSTLRRSVARVRPDRIARAWLKATRKLEKLAGPRAPDDGAMNYARRVAMQHPQLANDVTALATRYTQLRFGPQAANEDIAALEREVRELVV
jgi:hypothetical protein